jgi:hypothetical protein
MSHLPIPEGISKCLGERVYFKFEGAQFFSGNLSSTTSIVSLLISRYYIEVAPTWELECTDIAGLCSHGPDSMERSTTSITYKFGK